MCDKRELLRKLILDAAFDITLVVIDSLPQKDLFKLDEPKIETMEMPAYKFMKKGTGKVNGKRKRNPDRWR